MLRPVPVAMRSSIGSMILAIGWPNWSEEGDVWVLLGPCFDRAPLTPQYETEASSTACPSSVRDRPWCPAGAPLVALHVHVRELRGTSCAGCHPVEAFVGRRRVSSTLSPRWALKNDQVRSTVLLDAMTSDHGAASDVAAEVVSVNGSVLALRVDISSLGWVPLSERSCFDDGIVEAFAWVYARETPSVPLACRQTLADGVLRGVGTVRAQTQLTKADPVGGPSIPDRLVALASMTGWEAHERAPDTSHGGVSFAHFDVNSVHEHILDLVQGSSSVCAILSSGVARCWGGNSGVYRAASGVGRDQQAAHGPYLYTGFDPIVQLEIGYSSTCSLSAYDKVRCVGAEIFIKVDNVNVFDHFAYAAARPVSTYNTYDDSRAYYWPYLDLPTDTPPAKITLQNEHACALFENGRITCWGENAYGQLGYGHTDLVGDDETPAEAGYVQLEGRVVDVDAGKYYTCVIFESRDGVKCWGKNDNAIGVVASENLGDDESLLTVSNVSLPFDGETFISKVDIGEYAAVFLLDNGKAYISGYYGSRPPVLLDGLTDVADIHCNGIIALLLDTNSDDNCVTFGLNFGPQLLRGDPTNPIAFTPGMSTVPVGKPVRRVSSGANAALYLTVDEYVYPAGNVNQGSLGLGEGQKLVGQTIEAEAEARGMLWGRTVDVRDSLIGMEDVFVPMVDVVAETGLVGRVFLCAFPNIPTEHVRRPSDKMGMQVSAGSQATCTLVSSGQVVCWGSGAKGFLGYGNQVDIGDDEYPSEAGFVDHGGSVCKIDVGIFVTMALMCDVGDGSARIARPNGWQIDDTLASNADFIGDDESPSERQVLTGGLGIVDICTSTSTCVILEDDSIRCVGKSNLGYERQNTIRNLYPGSSQSTVPVEFPWTEMAWERLFCGARSNCAQNATGDVWCWSSYDQTIANGLFGVSDGTLEAPNRLPLVGVEEVGVGVYHSCFVLAEGAELVCVGARANGALGDGVTSNTYVTDFADATTIYATDVLVEGERFVDVECGNGLTCTLSTLGRVRCVGANGNGQLGMGDTATRSTFSAEAYVDIPPVVDIDVSSYANRVCAVTAGGETYCWGVGGIQMGQPTLGNSDIGRSSSLLPRDYPVKTTASPTIPWGVPFRTPVSHETAVSSTPRLVYVLPSHVRTMEVVEADISSFGVLSGDLPFTADTRLLTLSASAMDVGACVFPTLQLVGPARACVYEPADGSAFARGVWSLEIVVETLEVAPAGGTEVVLRGDAGWLAATGGASVRIDGKDCEGVSFSVDATEITCTSPVGVSGDGLSVQLISSSSIQGVQDALTALPALAVAAMPPHVVFVAPDSFLGTVGGELLRIQGRNFGIGGSVPRTVTVDGRICGSVTSVSDNEITCVLPAMAGVDLEVLLVVDGLDATYESGIPPTISCAQPQLELVEPEYALAGPGGLLSFQITGTNLAVENAEEVEVSVGGLPCGEIVIDVAGEVLRCLGVNASVDVWPDASRVLVTFSGGDMSSGRVRGLFEGIAYVTVSGAVASDGRLRTTGGDWVTVAGSGFGRVEEDVDGVWLSDTFLEVGSGDVLWSSVQLKVKMPSGVGTRTVRVQMRSGALSREDVQVSYDAPTVTKLMPSYLLGGGDLLEVVLEGESLGRVGDDFLGVWVGGVRCGNVTVLVPSYSILCSGLNASSGWSNPRVVQVDLVGGASSGGVSGVFSGVGVPLISAIASTGGSVSTFGGSVLAISGSGFGLVGEDIEGIWIQDVDGVNLPKKMELINHSELLLKVRMPAGVGRVKIWVETIVGARSNEVEVSFDGPEILEVVPNYLLAGGDNQSVVLRGQNLGNVVEDFDRVRIGGLDCSSLEVLVEGSKVACLGLDVSAGWASALTLEVVVGGQSSGTVRGLFEGIPLPSVVAATAVSGEISTVGTSWIKISGVGFGRSAGDLLEVILGGEVFLVEEMGVDEFAWGATELEMLVPSGTGQRSVVVVNRLGAASVENVFVRYTLPSVERLVPNYLLGGGEELMEVVVVGKNLGVEFDDFEVVLVGGKECVELEVLVAGERLRCVVNATSSWPDALGLEVRLDGGISTGRVAGVFEGVERPSVTAVVASDGVMSTAGGNVITVAGNGFGKVEEDVAGVFVGGRFFGAGEFEWTPLQLRVLAPPGTGSPVIRVVSRVGASSLEAVSVKYDRPQILQVLPEYVLAGPGSLDQRVLICGANMAPAGADSGLLKGFVGGLECLEMVAVNASCVECVGFLVGGGGFRKFVAPTSVSVSMDGISSGVVRGVFRGLGGPEVSTIQPRIADRGEQLSVFGANFGLTLEDVKNATLGGVACDGLELLGEGTILCTVPTTHPAWADESSLEEVVFRMCTVAGLCTKVGTETSVAIANRGAVPRPPWAPRLMDAWRTVGQPQVVYAEVLWPRAEVEEMALLAYPAATVDVATKFRIEASRDEEFIGDLSSTSIVAVVDRPLRERDDAIILTTENATLGLWSISPEKILVSIEVFAVEPYFIRVQAGSRDDGFSNSSKTLGPVHEVCDEDEYLPTHLPISERYCLPCPSASYCGGLATPNVTARTGMWRVPWGSHPLSFTKCRLDGACLGYNSSSKTDLLVGNTSKGQLRTAVPGMRLIVDELEQCAEGRQGVMCDSCADSYYRAFLGACLPCGNPIEAVIRLTGIMIGVMVIVTVMLIRADLAAGAGSPAEVIVLKICLTHFQSVVMVGAISIGWPSETTSFFSVLDAFTSFSVSDGASVDCYIGHSPFVGAALSIYGAPLGLLAFALVLWCVIESSVCVRFRKLLDLDRTVRDTDDDELRTEAKTRTTEEEEDVFVRKRRQSLRFQSSANNLFEEDKGFFGGGCFCGGCGGRSAASPRRARIPFLTRVWRRIQVSFVVLLFVVHTSVTKAAVKILTCVDVGPDEVDGEGEMRLVANLEYRCDENAGLMNAISLPALVIMSIGLPVLLAVFLRWNSHRLGELSLRRIFGFAVSGFGEKTYAWESLILLRKFLIVVAAVYLSPMGPLVQLSAVLFVILVATILHASVQPFHSKSNNRLELMALSTASATLLLGVLLASEPREEVVLLCNVVILFSNVGFILFAILTFAFHKCLKKVQKRRRKRHFATTAPVSKEVVTKKSFSIENPMRKKVPEVLVEVEKEAESASTESYFDEPFEAQKPNPLFQAGRRRSGGGSGLYRLKSFRK